jgi:hypothetical protein
MSYQELLNIIAAYVPDNTANLITPSAMRITLSAIAQAATSGGGGGGIVSLIWNNTTIYNVGDVVIFGNKMFISKTTNNVNNQPEQGTNWDSLLTDTTLQQVTVNGNTTNQSIITNELFTPVIYLESVGEIGVGSLDNFNFISDFPIQLIHKNGVFTKRIVLTNTSALTENINITFQDKSGVVALIEDVEMEGQAILDSIEPLIADEVNSTFSSVEASARIFAFQNFI